MGDISFTATEVAIVTALLTALSAPLAFLFHALRSSYIDRITEYRDSLIEARKINDQLRPAIEAQSASIREQTRLLERMLERSGQIR